MIAGQDRNLAGQIRVATTVDLGTYWLASNLPRWHRCHPKIEIELLVGISLLNLMRRKADVAFRIGAPGADNPVRRKVGLVSFGLYGATTYFKKWNGPDTIADLRRHVTIE